MIKQMIMAATFLLIHDAPEAIQCIEAILDFAILAEYILHDKELLCYMEHVIFSLEKIKEAFEQHWLIDSKL